MFYAERLNDQEYWEYKTTPDGEWTPFTVDMLTRKIRQMEDQLKGALEAMPEIGGGE